MGQIPPRALFALQIAGIQIPAVAPDVISFMFLSGAASPHISTVLKTGNLTTAWPLASASSDLAIGPEARDSMVDEALQLLSDTHSHASCDGFSDDE